MDIFTIILIFLFGFLTGILVTRIVLGLDNETKRLKKIQKEIEDGFRD